MAATKRGSGSKAGGLIGDGEARSECCMRWLVTIFKVVLIIMLIVAIVLTTIFLVKRITDKEVYIKRDGSETQYWINLAALIVALICELMLICVVACEDLIGLVITLCFMAVIMGYKIYTRNDHLNDMMDKLDLIFFIVQWILLFCYAILLCFY